MKCEVCSHRQNFDGLDRCCRLHDSNCMYVYDKVCKGDYFMHIRDGLSLYAMESWSKRLGKDEKELPLVIQFGDMELSCRFAMRLVDCDRDRWVLYCVED